jgi:hypothetical protein
VFSCDFRLSVALAVLFSLSINYSVFVFSVAGLPLCLYLLIKDDRVVIRSLLMLFIGWNSSIYLSGGFFAVSAPVFLLFVLRKTIDRFVVLKLASYFAGLLLGNAGLIWLSLSTGTVWHRAEWKMHDLLNFEINPFWAGNPWFHVGPPMFFLFGVSILIFILTRSERLGRCLLLALLIPVFYLIVQSERTQLWIDGIGGFLRSLQFDRFYFLWPLIVIVSTVFAAQAKPGRARAWVFGAVAVQIVLVATTVPQWRLSLRKLFFEQPLKPFQEYYMENWFKASHLESSDVVMSVGVDPMLAPMNRVPSIDGYYSLYPLEYKHKFSEVIRNSLPPSGKANYFNKWGIEFMYFNRRVVPSLLISVRETGLEPNL